MTQNMLKDRTATMRNPKIIILDEETQQVVVDPTKFELKKTWVMMRNRIKTKGKHLNKGFE